jgi:hypothetical protein
MTSHIATSPDTHPADTAAYKGIVLAGMFACIALAMRVGYSVGYTNGCYDSISAAGRGFSNALRGFPSGGGVSSEP